MDPLIEEQVNRDTTVIPKPRLDGYSSYPLRYQLFYSRRKGQLRHEPKLRVYYTYFQVCVEISVVERLTSTIVYWLYVV
jgi:hypothetical protein